MTVPTENVDSSLQIVLDRCTLYIFKIVCHMFHYFSLLNKLRRLSRSNDFDRISNHLNIRDEHCTVEAFSICEW